MTKTEILDQLKPNHAGALVLDDGTTINYGVIRKEADSLVYYTGKGLREIWAPNKTPEQLDLANRLKSMGEDELISSGHIAVMDIRQIHRILF